MARMIGLGWVAALVSMAACSWRAADQPPPDSGLVPIGDASTPETDSDHPTDRDDSPEVSQDAGHDRPVDGSSSDGLVDGSSTDGADREVEADRPDAAPAVRIWTDASTAIDVLCTGHHEGQMRFRARRDQLSTDQLALLGNVTTAPPQPGPSTPDACFPDVLSCTIAISGAGGSNASYFVYAFDDPCGGHDNLIADSTFHPFRASLPCRYGLEVGPGSPPLPPLAPDERCFNGLALLSNVPETLLAESQPGVARHVEIDGCPPASGPLALQVFAESGMSPIADGAAPATPGPDATCLRLEHTFDVAGSYRMHVSVPGTDASEGFIPANLFYRYY